MAEVYLAIQESLGRQVALKITSPWQSQDPAFKERFMQEGRIVATLNHPNIVTIHEIGQVDEQYFIAMEYVSGKSLSEKIEEGMTLEDSIQTVKRVARALAYAHNGGFLHRDIKPSNILFRDDEYAVLADFGIARALVEDDTRLTQTGMSPGSPAYMSPEQVNGFNLDARSDQYSLGIVFYEMLTGDRPYKGNSATATAILHLTAPVPQLPHPYESLQPIFDRLLAKTPEERFTDEEALIQALDEPDSVESKAPAENDSHAATALGRTQVRMEKTRVASPSVVQKPGKKMPSMPLRWVGIAALGAVAVAGAAFWLQMPSSDPADGLAQENRQETVAGLPSNDAEIETAQEADRKEELGESIDTQKTADSQVAEAKSEVAQLPKLNEQQAGSPDLQEPTDSKRAEAKPEIAPMPGLNGQQANTPKIEMPTSSQVVEAVTPQEPELNEEPENVSSSQESSVLQTVEMEEPEVALTPDLDEEQKDSSDTQKLSDSPLVKEDTEAPQTNVLNEEQPPPPRTPGANGYSSRQRSHGSR